MEELDIQILIEHYYLKLRSTPLDFKRYLYNEINWDARIIGIRGARGVGKTTLLLQRIKEHHKSPEEALYVSLDDLWFATHTFEDLVRYASRHGITHLYVDEVHKYEGWSRVLKNVYDFYPDISVVYTGSAILAINHSKADLSRRQTLYTLRGMSFREYLRIEGLADIKAFTLKELLANHVSIASELSTKTKVLKHFSDYLRHGYYPYYRENLTDFPLRVAEVVKLVIETDIPAVEGVSVSTVGKLKTLLMIMAQSTPFEPNISKLSEKLDCGRELCMKMIDLLDSAQLIRKLNFEAATYKQISGVKKILGGDTNILASLSDNVDTGTMRETFFANQVSAAGSIALARKGDLIADGKYLFEVGGPNKKFTQIADIPDSYLAVDGIEVGYGSRIPLYLFGFLY